LTTSSLVVVAVVIALTVAVAVAQVVYYKAHQFL
jgi:hypothetical protein